MTNAALLRQIKEIVTPTGNVAEPDINVSALKNASLDATAFEEQLSSDFREFPSNGKCHQRVIRERMAEQPEPDEHLKREAASAGILPSGDTHPFLLIPCDENHPGIEGCDYSTRYGSSSLKMTTGELAAGEYAVGHPYGAAVFCFGVD